MAWEKRLNYIPRIATGQRLNNTAWSLRKPYVQWVDEMGKPYGRRLDWWTSMVGDKNTLSSPLFLYLCYIYLVVELFEERAVGNVLVIGECWSFLRTLRKILHTGGHRVNVVPGCSHIALFEYLKLPVWFVGAWLRFVKEVLEYQKAARITKKEIPFTEKIPGTKPVALIHTCVDENCFGKNGQFHDRYFPGLAQWLREQDYDVVLLPFLYQIKRSVTEAYRWFRLSGQRFLLPEDHVAIKDYFHCVITIMREIFIPRRSVRFHGWDVASLIFPLRWEQARNRANARFLSYIPMLRHLAEKGWNLSLFVDKFENMPKEKPQLLALENYFPGATSIGYQHASLPPFMLKYTSTRREFSEGLFPDIVVSNGPWFKERLEADGVPIECLRVGPSLRYSYLFSEKKSPRSSADQSHRKTEDATILIVLTLDLNTALELLSVVFNGLANYPVKILIKPHPMSDRKQILQLLGHETIPSNMEWIDGVMKDWLRRVDCVVASGSASIMEAAAYGVPTVVVGRECGLDMNPLGWWENTYPEFKPIFSPEGLRKAVDRICQMAPEEMEKRTQEIRHELLKCYSRVNNETMNSFLP
ncbi:MAG: hypothetical protein JRH09_11675 [Deltaproteobacteria bacterium]|nr:hypothetical protein [Deltaproteobacteria bacterium]